MRWKEWNEMRVQKTLRDIREAFYHLVERKNYDQLTVSALCMEAGVGRKTFYMYYPSLDALFEEMLESIIKDYVKRISIYKVPDNIKEITREFYLFSLEQGKFYENLVCSNDYQEIGNRLLNKFVKETWKNEEWFINLKSDLQDILLDFIYNTGSGLYKMWVKNGKKIKLDDMINYADILLSDGIYGFYKMAII